MILGHCRPPAAGAGVKGPEMAAPASLRCWRKRLETQGRVRAGTGSSWLTKSEGQRGADPAERDAAGSRHPWGYMGPASLGQDPPWPRSSRYISFEVYAMQ